ERAIAGIYKQARSRKRQQLALAGDDDEVVAADGADDRGPDLLIAAAEHIALAADDADHDAGRLPAHQRLDLVRAQVAADQASTEHRIHPEQRALHAEMLENSLGARARPHDVDHPGID